MFLACFLRLSKYTVTFESPRLALFDVLRGEGAFHPADLCIFSFTAYSVLGLQFCAAFHLLVLGVLSSLDN